MYQNLTKSIEAEHNFTKSGVLINEYEKITAPSNRRLKCKSFSLPLIIEWSIDRITIVGKLKKEIFYHDDYDVHVVDFEQLMNLNEGQGFLESVRPGAWKIVDKHKENIAYIEILKYQKGYGRIDFNPAKINSFVAGGMKHFIHKLFLDPHFSRADVAVDIIDIPDEFITQYRIIDAVGTKIIYGRDKQPETFYWGARSSEKQVRLYNKKKEQLKKRKIVPDKIKSWWRLEAQLRRDKASDWYKQIFQVFDNFCSTKYLPIDTKPTDKIMLAGLMSDESLWSELSSPSRRKYRNLLREESKNDELTNLLRQTFSESADDLKNELDTWLYGFDVSEENFDEAEEKF